MMMPWLRSPWAYGPVPRPSGCGRRRLMAVAGGGFPVPESVPWQQLPPAVKASVLRLVEGPPKPAVTLAVMNQAQATMIAPDLPNRADV